MVFSG